eukprot:SAG11_NODE_17956_length_504_cov_1.093827_1_plen_98_part_10
MPRPKDARRCCSLDAIIRRASHALHPPAVVTQRKAGPIKRADTTKENFLRDTLGAIRTRFVEKAPGEQFVIFALGPEGGESLGGGFGGSGGGYVANEA